MPLRNRGDEGSSPRSDVATGTDIGMNIGTDMTSAAGELPDLGVGYAGDAG